MVENAEMFTLSDEGLVMEDFQWHQQVIANQLQYGSDPAASRAAMPKAAAVVAEYRCRRTCHLVTNEMLPAQTRPVTAWAAAVRRVGQTSANLDAASGKAIFHEQTIAKQGASMPVYLKW